MILEVAILNVIPGKEKQFEPDFKLAGKYISSINEYVKHSLKSSRQYQKATTNLDLNIFRKFNGLKFDLIWKQKG